MNDLKQSKSIFQITQNQPKIHSFNQTLTDKKSLNISKQEENTDQA